MPTQPCHQGTAPVCDWDHMTPENGNKVSIVFLRWIIFLISLCDCITDENKTTMFLTWPTWYPSRAATLSGSILLDVDLWPRRPDSPLPKVKSFPSAVTTAECRKPQASWEEQTHMTRTQSWKDAINTWCAFSQTRYKWKRSSSRSPGRN